MRTMTTVHATSSRARDSFRITFSRGRRSVVFRSIAPVSAALGLSDGRVRADMDPQEAAELVMDAVDRHGVERLEHLERWNRRVSLLDRSGLADPHELREQRALWTHRHWQVCVDVADTLATAAGRGRLAGPPAIPAARSALALAAGGAR